MEPSQPPQECVCAKQACRDCEPCEACEVSPQGCGGAAQGSQSLRACFERPHFVFIVTSYGCNSTPSDLWVPHSKIFMKYDEAYAYFLKESPPLDDDYNRAEQVIHNIYKEGVTQDDMTKDYVIIEHRVELAGYHCGDGHYAKRPRGAVIARSIIQ